MDFINADWKWTFKITNDSKVESQLNAEYGSKEESFFAVKYLSFTQASFHEVVNFPPKLGYEH